MLDRVNWSELSASEKSKLMVRPEQNQIDSLQVASLLESIRDRGDCALRELSLRFDQVELEKTVFETQDLSIPVLPPSLQTALEKAKANIENFHKAQIPEPIRTETQPGIVCEQIFRPIDRVGIYIPAGSAPLFSTVLMLAIPAKIAGCRDIVLASPPQKNGQIDPTIAAAGALCGVTEFLPLGGIQAIGAFAFGSESIKPVQKIFGPGNSYVTEAKRQVSQLTRGVGVDLPAGPSEVLVIADGSADPNFVAWDLLSQAEHGPDSQVLLVTNSAEQIESVRHALENAFDKVSRKSEVKQTLQYSRAILCESLQQAADVSNQYGPEHLIINSKEPRAVLNQITSAGSIFLGPWSPESVGDYASGTNHVLPTSAASHFTGGVNLRSFLRSITVQELSKDGLEDIAETVTTMADAEGLQCHGEAVRVRQRGRKA